MCRSRHTKKKAVKPEPAVLREAEETRKKRTGRFGPQTKETEFFSCVPHFLVLFIIAVTDIAFLFFAAVSRRRSEKGRLLLVGGRTEADIEK